MRLAFATCVTLPEPDCDQELFLEAAREAGLQAELAAWDDDGVNWNAFDLVVVRSTWNYYERESDFRRWIEHVDRASNLLNPAQLMLENIHKRYLLDLQSKGVPIVPTRLIDSHSPLDIRTVLEDSGWQKFVVKPAVSASSYMTRAFTLSHVEEAQQFLSTMLLQRDAMVQEYVESIPDGGETAFVHIAGELTHGVIKNPRFAEGEEAVSEAVQPTAEQRALTEQVLGTIEQPWLYARADIMLGNDGRWLLSELELIEPSLFFRQSPYSLQKFTRRLVATSV